MPVSLRKKEYEAIAKEILGLTMPKKNERQKTYRIKDRITSVADGNMTKRRNPDYDLDFRKA